MQIVPINPADPIEERLLAGVEVLASGGVVAVPTETFYGLAVDALSPSALSELNRLKSKPPDSPVLLLLADAAQVSQVCDAPPAMFLELAGRFWPGPLTLVVPARADVPREISGGAGTVGVRVPGLLLPRMLAARLGRPISGVSANRHGQPPCRTASAVVQTFGEGLGLIFDGGPTVGGAPSTVLDLTGPEPQVLRQGLLPYASLRPFIG